jgi:hypothetical protein
MRQSREYLSSSREVIQFLQGNARKWSNWCKDSVTLPNRARNKSPGTSVSRRGDDFVLRLQGRCAEGSVRFGGNEVALDVWRGSRENFRLTLHS